MRLSTFGNTQQVNTQSVSKQQGFTLIELVVVIVILGILAVTAAPKFIDLTSDAKGSVIEAVKGSMNSAADMAHAKALVAGKLAETGDAISVGTSTITLKYGWPIDASMASLLELDADITEVSASKGTFEHAKAQDGSECRAVYSVSAVNNAESRPSITSDTDKC
ncbi:MAG: type II secretion system protein [Colwellia sp.]|nr:type II secretion system protein [Colwellia sp.]